MAHGTTIELWKIRDPEFLTISGVGINYGTMRSHSSIRPLWHQSNYIETAARCRIPRPLRMSVLPEFPHTYWACRAYNVTSKPAVLASIEAYELSLAERGEKRGRGARATATYCACARAQCSAYGIRYRVQYSIVLHAVHAAVQVLGIVVVVS